MSAIKKGAAAPAIPSLYVLKGEAIHMRAEAKANGQTMGHRTSLKKVATKYGFRSWEALEAASRVNEANQGHHAYTLIQGRMKPSVELLIINDNDEILIVNRKIVGVRDWTKGGFRLGGIAKNLAEALGIDLRTEDIKLTSGFDPYCKDFNHIALSLGRINPEAEPAPQVASFNEISSDQDQRYLIRTPHFDGATTPVFAELTEEVRASVGTAHSVLHFAIDDAPMPRPMSFDEVVAIAQDFEAFEISHAPHIDFEILLDTESHPDRGDIDYMVSVTLSVETGKPIWARYCAYVRTEFEGRIDALPPSDYLSRAEGEVMKLLNDLIEAGINIDLNQLADESQGKTYDPQRGL
jgi:hypothetical protein